LITFTLGNFPDSGTCLLTLVLCAWHARNSQIETKLNVTFFKLKKKERKILNSIFEMILYNIANIDLRWATHTFYTWLRSVLTCLSVWRSCETSYSYILHMALFCTHLFISMTFLWDELLLYSTSGHCSVLTCLSVWHSCETSYSYILHRAIVLYSLVYLCDVPVRRVTPIFYIGPLFCTHLFISMTFLWDELLIYFT
jgi:hypothetical protein